MAQQADDLQKMSGARIDTSGDPGDQAFIMNRKVARLAGSPTMIVDRDFQRLQLRILLSSGTDGQVKKFLNETKEHFQFNEIVRYLFPEMVPQGNYEAHPEPPVKTSNTPKRKETGSSEPN